MLTSSSSAPLPLSAKARKAQDDQLDQLSRDFERLNKELAPFATDEAVMRLPHPLRALASAPTQPRFFTAGVVGLEFERYTIEQLRAGMSTNALWQQLESMGAQTFLSFIQANAGERDGGDAGGSSGAMFQAMRYQHGAGTLFTVDEKLLELLMLTDIDLDVPITEVRLPYPNVYIEFGQDRLKSPVELALRNPLSGLHAFEGAYVSQTRDAGGMAHLEVTMTGSPVGHTELSDDAVEWISMAQIEGRSIDEALKEAFTSGLPMLGATQDELLEHQRKGQIRREEVAPLMARRLELILKALLYIDLKDARTALIAERSAAEKALARAQSGAHRRKALRQLMRSRQSILVLPPAGKGEAGTDLVSDDGSDGTPGHGVAAHWRRGHFRRQRHGAGMALSKVLWIAPQLINAALLGELALPTKRYVVKA